MKNLRCTFLAMFLAVTGLMAQSSNLVIFSDQGERFSVVLNGIKMNETPETNVKITSLNNDFVKAKVIFEDAAIPDMDQNVMLAVGKELTLIIKKNKKGDYKMGWFGEVELNQAPPAPMNQRVIVFGAPVQTVTSVGGTVQETRTTTTTTGGTTSGAGINVNIGTGIGTETIGMNVTITDGMMGGTTGTTTYSSTTTTTTTSSGGGTMTNNGTSTSSSGCLYAMGDSDFRSAKSTISGQSFDDSKLKIAKQIAGSNCLSASQIKEIMGLMSFEESKLDFAKYAYSYCYDRNNYFKINDAFSFSGSVDELNTYIGSGR